MAKQQQQTLDYTSRQNERWAKLRSLDLPLDAKNSRLRFLLEFIEAVAREDSSGEQWLKWNGLIDQITTRLSLPRQTLYDTISYGATYFGSSGFLHVRRDRNQIVGLAIDWRGVNRFLSGERTEKHPESRDVSRVSGQHPESRDSRPESRDTSYISPEESKNSPRQKLPSNPPQPVAAAASTARAEDILIPDCLDCETFRVAWAEWIAYRRERRISVRERTLVSQLVALTEIGPSQAADCLRLSIRNGWQGMFPEKFSKLKSGAGVVYDPNAVTDI